LYKQKNLAYSKIEYLQLIMAEIITNLTGVSHLFKDFNYPGHSIAHLKVIVNNFF